MDKKLKILMVRLSAIGDVVHCLPALYSLRETFPDAYIAWVVEDKAADILVGNPLLDKVYIFPKKRWKEQGLTINTCKEFLKFINTLRKEKFDIAIDFQGLFKSGLITFLSGAKRRIGHAKTREFADMFINEKLEAHDVFDPDKMIIERYLEPVEHLGASIDNIKFSLPPVNDETKEYIDGLLSDIDKNKPIIICSPATIWYTKHWLEHYWSELLDKLAPDYNIIFSGAPQDKDLVHRITSMANTDNYLSLIGKTNLSELIELFNRADIVIAPDTGPAHIANAVEKPTIITIFGSTSFKRSCPYGEKHIALSAQLSCQPCFSRKCPKKTLKMECMKSITPEIVFNAINQKFNYIPANITS